MFLANFVKKTPRWLFCINCCKNLPRNNIDEAIFSNDIHAQGTDKKHPFNFNICTGPIIEYQYI